MSPSVTFSASLSVVRTTAATSVKFEASAACQLLPDTLMRYVGNVELVAGGASVVVKTFGAAVVDSGCIVEGSVVVEAGNVLLGAVGVAVDISGIIVLVGAAVDDVAG
jgi:hypothetical protein